MGGTSNRRRVAPWRTDDDGGGVYAVARKIVFFLRSVPTVDTKIAGLFRVTTTATRLTIGPPSRFPGERTNVSANRKLRFPNLTGPRKSNLRRGNITYVLSGSSLRFSSPLSRFVFVIESVLAFARRRHDPNEYGDPQQTDPFRVSENLSGPRTAEKEKKTTNFCFRTIIFYWYTYPSKF